MKAHLECPLSLRGQSIRGSDAKVREAVLILILPLSDTGKVSLLSEIFFSLAKMEL